MFHSAVTNVFPVFPLSDQEKGRPYSEPRSSSFPASSAENRMLDLSTRIAEKQHGCLQQKSSMEQREVGLVPGPHAPESQGRAGIQRPLRMGCKHVRAPIEPSNRRPAEASPEHPRCLPPMAHALLGTGRDMARACGRHILRKRRRQAGAPQLL